MLPREPQSLYKQLIRILDMLPTDILKQILDWLLRKLNMAFDELNSPRSQAGQLFMRKMVRGYHLVEKSTNNAQELIDFFDYVTEDPDNIFQNPADRQFVLQNLLALREAWVNFVDTLPQGGSS